MIKCNSPVDCCRRRLDGAEHLSAPVGSRCKRVPSGVHFIKQKGMDSSAHCPFLFLIHSPLRSGTFSLFEVQHCEFPLLHRRSKQRQQRSSFQESLLSESAHWKQHKYPYKDRSM